MGGLAQQLFYSLFGVGVGGDAGQCYGLERTITAVLVSADVGS